MSLLSYGRCQIFDLFLASYLSAFARIAAVSNICQQSFATWRETSTDLFIDLRTAPKALAANSHQSHSVKRSALSAHAATLRNFNPVNAKGI